MVIWDLSGRLSEMWMLLALILMAAAATVLVKQYELHLAKQLGPWMSAELKLNSRERRGHSSSATSLRDGANI